jgi:hypothetical protein
MKLYAFRDSINTESRHIQLPQALVPLIWNYEKLLKKIQHLPEIMYTGFLYTMKRDSGLDLPRLAH